MWGASSNFEIILVRPRVSSRAPVWGASAFMRTETQKHASFKSCPRVGGIRVIIEPEPPRPSFKSCPRVGGIQQDLRLIFVLDFVSSRAPVWGASGATNLQLES